MKLFLIPPNVMKEFILISVYTSDLFDTDYEKEMVGNFLNLFMDDMDFKKYVRKYEMSFDDYFIYFKETIHRYCDDETVEYYKELFGE